MDNDIESRFTKPGQPLRDYVDSIWMLKNHSEKDKDVVIVPDSRIDLFFCHSSSIPFNCILMGLESEPTVLQLPAKMLTFAISFQFTRCRIRIEKKYGRLRKRILRITTGILGNNN